MSRSKTLYQLQQYDSGIDQAIKRIQAIDSILSDTTEFDNALNKQEEHKMFLAEKQKTLKSTEHTVTIQNQKITQNQNKLYSGAVTNPKDLEDLQLESDSLHKYLSVLEERQIEAMLESDQAQEIYDLSSALVEEISQKKQTERELLSAEKSTVESNISSFQSDRETLLANAEIPDMSIYENLRKSSGGIAVTLMQNSSCTACGSNIPSAIEQETRSPKKLSFCPACKRILHSGSS
jgi:predicted  nucleic acid-binding Zn-ribbon protein